MSTIPNIFIMEDNILNLKLMSIAYQCAKEFDHCPESDKTSEIKETCYFAERLRTEDIETALNKYCGESPSEIANRMCFAIDCL